MSKCIHIVLGRLRLPKRATHCFAQSSKEAEFAEDMKTNKHAESKLLDLRFGPSWFMSSSRTTRQTPKPSTNQVMKMLAPFGFHEINFLAFLLDTRSLLHCWLSFQRVNLYINQSHCTPGARPSLRNVQLDNGHGCQKVSQNPSNKQSPASVKNQ